MFDRTTVDWLLSALGYSEEPLGIYYADLEPEMGISPRQGLGHDCLMKYVRLARTSATAAWFSKSNTACLGGSVYAGFILPPPDSISHFVTTGLPGQEGEKYLKEPASMQRFFNEMDLKPAMAPYCVIKPLNMFDDGKTPLLVSFFVRGEVLTGLCQLAYFTLDDHDAVCFPFGAGCSNLLAWPLYYLRRNIDKGVIGGADPSCRKYMETDELTFTVSGQVFDKMLKAAPDSFLTGKTWAGVLRKIEKSRRTWAR